MNENMATSGQNPRPKARAMVEDLLAFGITDLPGLKRIRPAAEEAPRHAGKVEEEQAHPNAVQKSQTAADSLERIAGDVAACTRCRLASTRTNVVPGHGNQKARIFFIGEAPGADEDLSGLPFVGKAGQLLTKMIAAMGFTREEVFIANVLKCRPPENREPASDEAASCMPFLRRQIEVVSAEVIICLGGHAVRNVLGVESPVGRLRGRAHSLGSSKVVVTYHPSYLLREPQVKKAAWEDLKFALKLLHLPIPTPGSA